MKNEYFGSILEKFRKKMLNFRKNQVLDFLKLSICVIMFICESIIIITGISLENNIHNLNFGALISSIGIIANFFKILNLAITLGIILIIMELAGKIFIKSFKNIAFIATIAIGFFLSCITFEGINSIANFNSMFENINIAGLLLGAGQSMHSNILSLKSAFTQVILIILFVITIATISIIAISIYRIKKNKTGDNSTKIKKEIEGQNLRENKSKINISKINLEGKKIKKILIIIGIAIISILVLSLVTKVFIENNFYTTVDLTKNLRVDFKGQDGNAIAIINTENIQKTDNVDINRFINETTYSLNKSQNISSGEEVVLEIHPKLDLMNQYKIKVPVLTRVFKAPKLDKTISSLKDIKEVDLNSLKSSIETEVINSISKDYRSDSNITYSNFKYTLLDIIFNNTEDSKIIEANKGLSTYVNYKYGKIGMIYKITYEYTHKGILYSNPITKINNLYGIGVCDGLYLDNNGLLKKDLDKFKSIKVKFSPYYSEINLKNDFLNLYD